MSFDLVDERCPQQVEVMKWSEIGAWQLTPLFLLHLKPVHVSFVKLTRREQQFAYKAFSKKGLVCPCGSTKSRK